MVPGIAATFGRSCEVVLHDYRSPERSVIAVAGNVTGRRIGDPMSDIGRRVLAAGDAARTEENYLTRTPDGTVLKSTTIPLRDDDGTLLGALCINVDVTALARVRDAVGDLIGAAEPGATGDPPVTAFTPDLAASTDRIVAQHERAVGLPAKGFDRARRLMAIHDLRDAGVFELRGAPGTVAARLGVSRAGLYNDLRTIREAPDAATAPELVDEDLDSRRTPP
ncbi:Predicted transcriptional regulator YheO, contains PAS and DNA-binding HTH domains [Ruania alba]|uniref:Predicted transcriptional regulator YheO, contains PAS and DNA-binding HTH domains n=2 Tax=Ruania alba TaxID=648782 RepID=A0A1H5LJI2_9MICO|nr:Predicted transcriptional regulator YheO, contains PAS and DNA-binding HTH domains [Ruania alba]